MARRGSYAKGVAKREEILAQALEVVAREGFSGASVKELADAVGLSQAGLLHYFDSKEQLFTEILRKRDQVDIEIFAPLSRSGADLSDLQDSYVGVLRHNAEVPGLVQLFAHVSIDAADPGHPGHAYFVERGQGLRALFVAALERRQAEGAMTDRIPAETLARILQAVADGLQVQWMLDPSLDMGDIMRALFDALDPRDRTPKDADVS